jgi:hypothetical protein
MKKLIPLIILILILAGLTVVVASDTSALLADSNIPDNKLTTSQTEASNSTASATITITMYTRDDESLGLAKSDLFLWET